MPNAHSVNAAIALESIRSIIPELAGRANETVALRHVPDANVDALRRSGALKTLQSVRNGGHGLGMRDHLDVVAALGEGCGSTAWCAGVIQVHSWLLSHFSGQAQDDVYGETSDSSIAAVIGPRGVATRCDGGYTLSGFWPFASGNGISEWMMLGAVVQDENGEVVDDGDFLIPTTQVTKYDDWFVSGLAGTGSSSVSLDSVHIPEHRFLSFRQFIGTGSGPGSHLQEGWAHRCAPVPVLSLALTGAAIGIARSALAGFDALVGEKVIAYTDDVQRDHPVTHMQIASAAMALREGELLLFGCADELDDAARNGVTLDLSTRARMRLDSAQGVRRCLESVETLFHASGGSGARSASPLTRAVADLRIINQHGLLNLETNQELYGRVLMGLEPKTPLV